MKRVELDLMTLDGNAFALLAAFGRAARGQGWTDGEIESVRAEATSDDYGHLLRTLARHAEPPPEDLSS